MCFSYTGIPHIPRWSHERAAHASCGQQWRRPLTRAWRLNGPNFKWMHDPQQSFKTHDFSVQVTRSVFLSLLGRELYFDILIEPFRRDSRVWQTNRRMDRRTDIVIANAALHYVARLKSYSEKTKTKNRWTKLIRKYTWAITTYHFIFDYNSGETGDINLRKFTP